MAENKQQTKRSYKSLMYFLALMFGAVIMLITMWMLGFGFWLRQGSVKPNLDAEYIPTAEYLLENPFEEPATGFDGLNIDFRSIADNEICFTIFASDNADFDRANIVEVFINEQLAARVRADSFILTSLPAQKPFCISGTLDTGLHIVEVRAYSDMFLQANYVRRWATEVE